MVIDFIFDLVCPWCYIGKRRLERALELRPRTKAEIRWRHFLLNPELPPEGLDRTAYLIRKFGSETRVARVYGSIGEAGQSVEIDFDFDHINRTPNTLNAHRLVLYAGRSGKAAEMAEALFRAYFIGARDIGDIEVLARTGKSLGFTLRELRSYLKSGEDAGQIYEDNAQVHHMGINGVPAYAFNGKMIISGAQEPNVLARVIDASQAAIDADNSENAA